MTPASVAIMKWQREIFGVSDDDYKILTDLYQISPAMLEESVGLIRDWHSKQPHLPQITLDNRIFKRILATNKFSVEKTKWMLDNMFTSRNVIPEFFRNRDPWSKELSVAMDSFDWAFIPKLTPDNYRIHCVRVNGEDPDSYNPEMAFAVTFMVGDIRLSLDIQAGDIFVWDIQHLKLSHVVKFTPLMLKKAFFVAQCCYGSHIKGIHLVNIPPYAEFLVNVIKSAMKKKIADRVHVHKTLEELREALPKEFIPKDMGGEFPKTCREMADQLRNAMRSPEWRKVYLDSMEQKSDESKRTTDSETADDELQGLKGTFRKLDID